LNRRIELFLVTGLLLLAAALRIWDLTRLPPGFSNDELASIRITETVRQGEVAVYYQIAGTHGRAGMYGIGNMLVTEWIGGGLFGYRLFPLWGSLLALALLYRLARRLFGPAVALIALGIMSTNLRAVLLARSATSESWVPAYTLVVLLLVVMAFNLRREVRFHTPVTPYFALLAVVLGASGYLHYTGLMLAPICLLFFLHLLITHQPLSRRVWSAGVFVIVLASVIATPYLASTIRHPALSEPDMVWSERPRSVVDGIKGALNAVGGVIWRGDASITHNLPHSALVGPVMAILLIVGVIVALRRWREPGYALILLVLAGGLLTDAWVGVSTTFSANLVLLPAIYILPGIGALAIWEALRDRSVQNATRLVAVGVLVLLAVDVIALRDRVFNDWPHRAEIQAGYHARLGYLAAYLDRTPDDLPVSFCAARLNEPLAVGLTPRQVLRLMMHRETLDIRHSDCRGGIVLINGGAPMRFAFGNVDDRAQMPPELSDWLTDAQPIPVAGLPPGSVLRVDVEQRVRDSGGYWAAFSTAYYMPSEDDELEPVELPAQLEQNLTFAGYDPRVLEGTRQAGGDPVVLITYWRVDGPLPRGLGIFAHLLAYTETEPRALLLEPWAEANTIDIFPSELRNRDIFAQVSYLWLSENMPPATYALTVGAYVDTVTVLDNHLDVLDPALNFQPHGDRLLLGDIIVEAPPPPADETPPDLAPGASAFFERLRELSDAWFNAAGP
jgi:4-amino-4-deoxy-L-arabinose transferase-like glycosyltransferase